FNENYDRIYRLESEDYGKLPPVIGTYVKEKIPEIENIARLALGYKLFITHTPDDRPEELKQIEVNFLFADSTTFDVFTLPFIQGDSKTALDNPLTVVLTESIARNLFGDKNPIGETIEWNTNHFEVTGIIKDVLNSHIEIDALFSFASIEKIYPDRDLNNAGSNSWLWSATYLLIEDKADPSLVDKKINNILAEINDGNLINIVFKNFHIRSMKDVYFNGTSSQLQFGKQGNLKMVQTNMVIAIFILALACINYINLTTARATLRAKEVAMKKVVGSSKTLLRYQFIVESILVSLISFLLAFTLVQGLMPQFNQLAMVNIHMAELNTPIVWALSILGVLSIGIISGIYPAIYLTSVKSVSLIKGGLMKGSKGTVFRRALLTFQFSISIFLIIGIITNLKQLHYARMIDLGFNKEQIIRILTPADFPEEQTLRKTIKERLLQNHNILKVSFSTQGPGEQPVSTPSLEIEGVERTFRMIVMDPDYLDLMGIEIVEGRGFSWDREGDKWPSEKSGVIINEAAAKQFWNESPLGKTYYWQNQTENRQWEIVGIARDFHFRSLHHNIEPLFLAWANPQFLLNIKVSPTEIPATIKFIEREWKNVYGSAPFSYTFLDEFFDQQYKSDEQAAKIIGYFTVLAIIIACMGLFALSSFMVVRRTKEIGIRKALGASANSIFIMLSKEFVKWVLLAVIIACPIAWILMNKW
ncbi:MAG: ABC transporter permease, partial [Cyclobacteriaceae bacterium]|nr:ABC transporter permease [Cyclobacteriaceae bacterium]